MVASTSWMKSRDAWLAMVSHLTSLLYVLVSFPGLEGSIPIILLLLTNKNVTLIYWKSQLMNKMQKILHRQGAPNINYPPARTFLGVRDAFLPHVVEHCVTSQKNFCVKAKHKPQHRCFHLWCSSAFITSLLNHELARYTLKNIP